MREDAQHNHSGPLITIITIVITPRNTSCFEILECHQHSSSIVSICEAIKVVTDFFKPNKEFLNHTFKLSREPLVKIRLILCLRLFSSAWAFVQWQWLIGMRTGWEPYTASWAFLLPHLLRSSPPIESHSPWEHSRWSCFEMFIKSWIISMKFVSRAIKVTHYQLLKGLLLRSYFMDLPQVNNIWNWWTLKPKDLLPSWPSQKIHRTEMTWTITSPGLILTESDHKLGMTL